MTGKLGEELDSYVLVKTKKGDLKRKKKPTKKHNKGKTLKSDTDNATNKTTKARISGSKSSHVCYKCGSIYADKYGLKKHLFSVHDECDKDTLVCELCKIAFNKPHAFERHKQKHESCSFKCRNCAASFSDNIALQKHSRKEHWIQHCKHCPATFHHAYYLDVS